jgi:riboflavin-specific deaminase-like protein
VTEQDAWRWLLAAGSDAAFSTSGASQSSKTLEGHRLFPEASYAARRLLDLYLPLCRGARSSLVVAHLGQSLDGRIAAANGESRWVTGHEDVVHNHRMRALFGAVVVGAGTVRYDDPQLTVREVPGEHPVRVVLDPARRLGPGYRVFQDGEADTLVLCDAALAQPGERLGQAEVIGVPLEDSHLAPRAVLECLAARGLERVFIEGGGVTVSRFLSAGCLDRLQITVAPVILGSGRPSLTLPEIDGPAAGLRPPSRRFELGEDILIECCFDA